MMQKMNVEKLKGGRGGEGRREIGEIMMGEIGKGEVGAGAGHVLEFIFSSIVTLTWFCKGHKSTTWRVLQSTNY